jgi:hypothetical protein
MSEDYEKLRAENAELQKQLDHWKAEHLKRQQGEDAALQKVKDQAAAHEADIAKSVSTALNAMNTLLTDHRTEMDEQHANLTKIHAASIAKLKAEVLVPALRDLHARQQADIAAKQQAELDALTKGD